ncbi:uncharacterized protein KD926_010506 [Aspergillus affinis]|uniref:uncharacterized protein n=1 Tax=Aspergillus affinis TaxID=1070780 RepID=UPI0022FEF7E0|nr:uncharacterized protein KD926_010506 [Aspergillus affinis]KAI9038666.1 hypothetical protein KD926_010506 [Aspergillus affinis]
MGSISSEFSGERSALIQGLSKATEIQMMSRITHAFIWLSDINTLKEHVDDAESGARRANMVVSILSSDERCTRTLKWFLARKQKSSDDDGPARFFVESSPEPPEPPEPSEHASVESPKTPTKRRSLGNPASSSKTPRLQGIKRSQPAKEIASNRDDDQCVITHMGEPIEICRIFPFSLGKKSPSDRHEFWSLLRNFWSSETLEKWKNEIFGHKGRTEVPKYLLCLSNIVHELWGMARLALEPIEMSEDKRSLTRRFWWLPRDKATEMVPMQEAPVLPARLEMSPLKYPLTMPLPSFELLHMQWVLTRVAALSGAADITDEELEDGFGGIGPVFFPLTSPENPCRPLSRSPRRDSNASENRPLAFRSRESSKIRELSEEPSNNSCDDPFIQ